MAARDGSSPRAALYQAAKTARSAAYHLRVSSDRRLVRWESMNLVTVSSQVLGGAILGRAVLAMLYVLIRALSALIFPAFPGGLRCRTPDYGDIIRHYASMKGPRQGPGAATGYDGRPPATPSIAG